MTDKTRIWAEPPLVPQIIAGDFLEKRGYATWRPRGTQDWLLIGTRGGSGRFVHENGETRAQAGDLVLIRPGTPHDYGTDADTWSLLWTHFHPRPHWREWLEWSADAPGLMRLHLDEITRVPVFRRFFDLVQWTVSASGQREAFAMNALEEILLRCDAANPLRRPVGTDARVRRALDFLQEKYAEPVSLAALAQVAGLSELRLGHLFRAQTGVSPQQFWEQQRLTRAQHLLDRTDRSVENIAAEVGYDSAFYFSTRFKKFTGQNPSDFRRSRRG